MRVERLARLCALMRGDPLAASHLTPVTPVTPETMLRGYRSKLLELQALQPLQVKKCKGEKGDCSPVTMPVTALSKPDADGIEERAALAADCVPSCYLDDWARLQCQRPFSIDLDAWRRAINDAGLFLDGWGAGAVAMHWSARDLFDAPRAGRPGGLVWQLKGERVEALGEDRAVLDNGHEIFVLGRPASPRA